MSGLRCASLGISEQRLAEEAPLQFAQLPFHRVFSYDSHKPAIYLAVKRASVAPEGLNHDDRCAPCVKACEIF